MADILLFPDSIRLVDSLDEVLELASSTGLLDEVGGPLPIPVPGMPGYGDLASASKQAIRETFRLYLGSLVYAQDQFRMVDEIVDRTSTIGDVTIDAVKGRFALDSGSDRITITNNRVTKNSVVVIVPEDDQSPMAGVGYWYVRPTTGSFTFFYDGSGYTGLHRFVVT